jgi:catechol 2,3-dioxygenase-like lactoylglutathione lyase family enzyme
MMGDELRVVGLDHVVLNVADVERSLAFYCGELGLAPVRVEEWRRGEAPFPSARIDAHTILDLLAAPRTGVNADHLCLVVEPVDLAAVSASGRFEVLDGPATRFGARGNGTSLYVRDPDGNTVELRHYGA